MKSKEKCVLVSSVIFIILVTMLLPLNIINVTASKSEVGISESFVQHYSPQKTSMNNSGWQQVNTSGFGENPPGVVTALEVFNNQLYAGTSNWATDMGARVWRYQSGTSWAPVSEIGFAEIYSTTNRALTDFVVFNNQLYASTGWGDNGGQIWRSTNGTEWAKVTNDEFNTPTHMFVFQNSLYIGADPASLNGGLEIWRSNTGDTGSWSRVVAGGFGNTNNDRAVGSSFFNNYLYVSVENDTDGVTIWRTNNGTEWNQVNTNGFGEVENSEICGMAQYDSYLYVGTRNESTGGQIWRSNNGTDWAKVVGDGFGNTNNREVESLIVHQNFLYANTGNIVTGMEVWKFDGNDWFSIGTGGFGNANNDGVLWNSVAIFDGSLLYGTWNANDGGEVWQRYIEFPVYLPLIIR